MRILVIEDDRELRETLVRVLDDAGHEVCAAVDGESGWRVLEEGTTSPEVILLDLLMPMLDGQGFRRRQLEDPRFAAIPTLVMTAVSRSCSLRTGLAPTTVMQKPMQLGPLLAAIDEMGAPSDARLKRCTCCGRVYDDIEWSALRSIGHMDNGRDVGERLELRLCGCGTSLAWQLGVHAVSIELRV